MTREEIESQYDVENGRIRSLGKFQSEAVYTPYFWDALLDGKADEDVFGSAFFIVTDEDRAEFPELADVYGIAISEGNAGFVDSYRLKTQKDYLDAVKNCEEMEAAESENEEL